ncbi:MAG: hypothetical protein J0L55_09845 [Caulobacterales bacterium]|nr:hypothetical protein [Caulobacterales bacterium]MCA0372812.1 hypothetical protein [Pseudomonadota bacterium]
MVSRRVLAYLTCFSLVAQPLLAQNAPTPKADNAAASSKVIVFDAVERDNYARILLKWAKNIPSPSRINVRGSLLEVTMPIPVNADPGSIKSNAPSYVVAAALSADKKTLRIALSKQVRVSRSKDGEIESIDLYNPDSPAPPSYSRNEAVQEHVAENDIEHKEKKDNGLNKPLKNWPAPLDARRLRVESAQNEMFTRVSIVGTGIGAPQIGRIGDRMALTIPGLYALDIANLRSHFPRLIKDAVRYNDATHTSVVMDLEPGAQIRMGRDYDRAYVDIFPKDANLAKLEEEANKAKEDAKAETKSANSDKHENNGEHKEEKTAHNNALLPPLAPSNLGQAIPKPVFEEPAPSGIVIANARDAKPNYAIDFTFQKMAPSAIFRRGANIFVLFATSADFKVQGFKPNGLASAITPIKGNGVAGVKITAPEGVFASPVAIGPKWLITLSNSASVNARSVEVKSETTLENNIRLKAIIADAQIAGSITDSDVGDDILVGLAMGPPSALQKSRSFLEAYMPETFQGIAVIPRADDLEIKPALDGFVLERPNGMSLSQAANAQSPAGFTISSPSFVDFKNWRMGPEADYVKNLNKLRLEASKEVGEANGGIKAQMDLARFYLAWNLAPEALGVLRAIKDNQPDYARTPELLGLYGASLALMGRGREALEILNSPELMQDAASHLWAAMAAEATGDPTEARKQFQLGVPALAAFSPQMQAQFKLNEAEAAYYLGDFQGSAFYAQAAYDLATEPFTKENAKLRKAMAQAENGQDNEANRIFAELEKSTFRQISARAIYCKAIQMAKDPNGDHIEAIRILDSLRYTWRGDDLEIDILRNLGELYIQAGDIRSGLATLSDASTLRPELPSARALRDTLSAEFKHLFLEGGADGMDSLQALALFVDFQDLVPMGPEGDQMVRGLADKLVKLDLLTQAEELLQHQADKRLTGFAKAQVASDLAAIYLLDKKPEKALEALWSSRETQLPADLNDYRRLIEAVAMTDLGRHDNALELLEFTNSKDADRIRAELYWRKGDYANAAKYAWSTLPAPAKQLDPISAGEVLRAAIAKSLAGDRQGVKVLANGYGAAMQNSAFKDAFNVVNSTEIPSAAQIKAAMASVQGSSPFGNLLKNIRGQVFVMNAPKDGDQLANIVGPTDANANHVGSYSPDIDKLNEKIAKNLEAVKAPQNAEALQQQIAKPVANAAPKATAQAKPAAPIKRVAQNTKPARSVNPAPQAAPNNRGFQAPKDPPIAVGR